MSPRSNDDFFCAGKTCFNRPRKQLDRRLFIKKRPFELENHAIQSGSKVITRKFALIPDSYYKRQEYKKITDRMVKFRDLENIYVRVLIQALQNGVLTTQHFEKPSKSFIKKNIYDNLKLTNTRATQFKSIVLKERIRRCAIQYPFQAVRNWLIRNHNLSRIIGQLQNLFRSNQNLISSFLLGKGLPRNALQSLHALLNIDLFGNNQSLSYFLLDNMIGQIRNIFLNNTSLENVLRARLRQLTSSNAEVQNYLKRSLSDFTCKKKSRTHKLNLSELPEYFLNRYFISLKSKDTRRVKKTMSKNAFSRYKRNRGLQLDAAKSQIGLRVRKITENQVWTFMLQAYTLVLHDYSTNPNILLTRHIFKPFFVRSPLSNPDFKGFIDFFKGVLQNKIREHFKELFATNQVVRTLLNDLNNIRQNINLLAKIPKISKLSLPIIAKEQVYREDYNNLRVRLSFADREFINLIIQDKRGTIATLLGEGAIPKVPVISFKRRKLILNLPFEVQKKAVSKQAHPLSGKKRNIEVGVDLGLKHFAVLSVMDTTNPAMPKEISQYFIGSKQLFDMKFDSTLGKFVKRRNYRVRNESNIKLKLMHLRREIRNIQRKKDEYEARHPDFKIKLKFHKLSETLSILWDKMHNINLEIVRLLNHHMLEIAKYHGASKIKMENLKFSKHSKKRERGKFLAFWQTHWLFSQIQAAVKLQADLNTIGFEQVGAAYTSQRCPECGMIEYRDSRGNLVYLRDALTKRQQQRRGLARTKSRDGKKFTCNNISNHSHHAIFRLDADLSAARNIVLA